MLSCSVSLCCCCVLPFLLQPLSHRGPELDSTLSHSFRPLTRGTARTRRCRPQRAATMTMTFGRARGFVSAPLNMLRSARTSNVHVKTIYETSILVGNNKTKRSVRCAKFNTLLGCWRATATPDKDVTSCDTLRKTVLMHRRASDQKKWLWSYPKTLSLIAFVTEHIVLRGCLRAFVLEHAPQEIHRLFGLEDACGRFTTCATLCHSRPLCPASRSKESFINCKSHLNTCIVDAEVAAAGPEFLE